MDGGRPRFRTVDEGGPGRFVGEIETTTRFLIDTAGDPPPIPWFLPGWMPKGETTLLAGAGGGGKSMIALQLQAATALGRPWLGLDVPQGRSLGFYSEDGTEAVANRLDAIGRHYGTGVDAMIGGGLRVLPKPADDVALITQERRDRMTTTGAFEALKAAIAEYRPALVILDNVADFLPVLGFDNAAIRMARRVALDPLCRDYGLTIIGLQNVTLHGLRAEDEAKGSAGGFAWRDAFRSRVVLSTDRGDTDDDTARIIEATKANYGGRQRVTIRWRDGLFVADPPAGSGGMVAHLEQRAHEAWLLDAVRHIVAEGRPYSTSPNAGAIYLPHLAEKAEGRPKGFGSKRLRTVYEDLVARDVIQVRDVPDSTKGRPKGRVVAVDGQPVKRET